MAINMSSKIQVTAGNVKIGSNAKISVQSMLNVPAEDIENSVKQAIALEKAGCDIVRAAIPNKEAVKLIPAIKEAVNIPLVADIHFRADLALKVIAGGIDAVRINPGNIGDESKIKAVLDAAKAKHIPIRIGVNSGSLDASLDPSLTRGEALIASAKKHVAICEKFDFHDLVISLKGSSVKETVDAYRLAAQAFPYPGAFFFYGDKKITVQSARIIHGEKSSKAPGSLLGFDDETGGARFVCKDGGVIEILRVKPEGKAEMWAIDCPLFDR
jgi:(E)-4-hydroxy-3-methylbut-2-enyl-diphosphate synthase